jgi:hypothetical protein
LLGHFAVPLPAGWLLMVMLVVTAGSLAIRLLTPFGNGALTIRLLTPFSCALILLAISVSGTETWAVALCALGLAAHETWLSGGGGQTLAGWRARLANWMMPPRGSEHSAVTNSAARTSASPTQELVTHDLKRSIAGDGAQCVRGSLAASMEAGLRVTSVYAAFCPPFERIPQLEFCQTAGPTAQIKLARLYCHGAEFEIKPLDASNGAKLISLEFAARSTPRNQPPPLQRGD